jgi:hypothetical protein
LIGKLALSLTAPSVPRLAASARWMMVIGPEKALISSL